MGKTLTRKSNMEALKSAFEKQKRGGDFKFWKPIKYGEYLVRFLPPKDPDGVFFKEAAQHKIGDNYYFCPKTEGEDCPICEKYRKLYDNGSDAAVKLAKEIKPRKQYLYNILVKEELGKETETPTKVQVYMSGKILYETLMDYFFDEEYGDLVDVETGYNFKIIKSKGDMDFPTYKSSRPVKTPTPLSQDEQEVDNILANLKDLRGEIDLKSYDELKKALNSYLKNEKDDSSDFIEKKAESKEESKEESKDDDDELNDFEKDFLNKLDD